MVIPVSMVVGATCSECELGCSIKKLLSQEGVSRDHVSHLQEKEEQTKKETIDMSTSILYEILTTPI